jgi:2-dehydropantoate 2-reductase
MSDTNIAKSIEPKSILIYGAGSIGCYLAAVLTKAGHCVDVVGRSKAKDIGKTLYINSVPYDFPKVLDEKQIKGYYNYVFVTSKFYDLRSNLEAIAKAKLKFDTLVLIQNTYVDDIWYYNLIKSKPIATISVYEGFNLDGNQLKLTQFYGWSIENDMLGKDVYLLLKGAGVNINFTDDCRIKRAEKTIVNSTLNALSAINKCTVKELFDKRNTLSQMKKLFSESYEVLSQIIKLKSKRTLWTSFLHDARNANHYTSTYQDVVKNKKTEVSFLNGFISELGKKMNIHTLENDKIIQEFKKMYPKLY